MPSVVKLEMVVLFEHEVQAAAAALKKAVDLCDNKDATGEEKGDALMVAVNACYTALHVIAEKPNSYLMLLRLRDDQIARNTVAGRLQRKASDKPG